ncbi:MAG: rRNA maturation RNase YbeY [Gammaproteobacteria bacterium]|nr:rRNA maturation RNase YbeY [Gammaproteobacteria bacterium]
MTLSVDISVSENIQAGNDDVPEPAQIQNWAKAAYLNDVPAVASLMVTDADEMQQLNLQYRAQDKPTNVLSFPMQAVLEDEVLLLGDIALCAPVINQEARQQAKPEMAHWAHMVVHGMLHLQGYDHIDNAEAEEMEHMEIEILAQLGFDNPYQ